MIFDFLLHQRTFILRWWQGGCSSSVRIGNTLHRTRGSYRLTGLRNRTARPSLAVQNPFSPCTVTHTDLSSSRGNKESPTKRSHFRGTLQPQRGIPQQSISCGKEGWSRTTSSNQSCQFQQVCEILPLKNGRLESSYRPAETGGFQARPEGCVFHHPFARQIPNIYPLLIQREDISIHLSPIRVNLSPTHLHQGTQTNSGYSEENGYPDNNLSRQHAHYEQHFQGWWEDILTLKYILESLGVLINLEKSVFIPVQVIEFLIDSTNMRFLLLDGNVAAIQKECRHQVSRQVASLNQLLQIIGKLTSCKIAVLQAPLYYRGTQHLNNSKPLTQLDNNVEIALDHHALEDLRW